MDPSELPFRRREMAPTATTQFTLRAMLLGVSLLAIALAIGQAVRPEVGLTLLMFFTMVFLHVAGNVLGSRLRDRRRRLGDATRDDDDPSDRASLDLEFVRPLRAEPHHFAPTTNLGSRIGLGWFPVVFTCCAGFIGAVAGGRALQSLNPATATWATLMVGGLAAGALTGMFVYWTSSWLQVVAGAWCQAHRDTQRRSAAASAGISAAASSVGRAKLARRPRD